MLSPSIRIYADSDHEQVVALFTRINRELAPADMRELFEEYISTAIDAELRQVAAIFSESKRNAFWVVEIDGQIVGMFGIESRAAESTELRRMYLDRPYRGRGIAQRMREFGFSKMILSTAEVQRAAIAFYRKSGYRLVRTERADTMSRKAVGGGLTRFHLEKAL